jgi:hypothetical protein
MAWRSETDRRIIPQPRETLNEGNVTRVSVLDHNPEDGTAVLIVDLDRTA